ncbi:MAG: outer membrane lipoprotein-sorting protein [Treponema sp.]|nr:outer membrane lipoprotein-sorting protein [Treponema sp.]
MRIISKTSFVYASFLLAAASALYAPALHAQTTSAAQAKNLLKKTDQSTAFMDSDFAANYSMVQSKPGQGNSNVQAVMYRRDSAQSYTILITAPSKDKGKGYVQFDNSIWFYDPADKQFVFTSSHERFQGSNANNSDLVPQHFSTDYSIEKFSDVTLGKLDCVLFELKASAKNVDYPTVKLWVTKEDGLIRKREDYSLSGQLLRTLAIPSYQKYGSHSVPDKMLIVDNLRGKKIDGKMQYEKTQITVTNVSFAKQSDTVYTKKYVEMMSK